MSEVIEITIVHGIITGISDDLFHLLCTLPGIYSRRKVLQHATLYLIALGTAEVVVLLL